LAGKLFDDRGNRMSPSHAAKDGRRWRYYVSQAVLQGRKHEAGSVARVPALEIERRVAEAVRAASSASNRQGWHELHQPRRAATARQSILQWCTRATTMQPYAPPSNASPSLERRSRSSLPRGWRVTVRIASG